LPPTPTDKQPISEIGHYLEMHFTYTAAAAKKERYWGLELGNPRLEGVKIPCLLHSFQKCLKIFTETNA